MKDQADIEDKIRIQVESSRIRLTEFFIDYDRLRSGFVTRTQFRRVLDQILKLSLTDEEINVICDKYDIKSNSKVNYRLFCNSINRNFPENDLKDDPQNFIYKNPEYLGTFRSMKNLDPNAETSLNDLLVRLNTYYFRRNLDILANFRDFDRNNIGILTESQFRRCMTEPSLSENELDILIRKYEHPDRKGFINYLNFYNDIKSNPEMFGNSTTFKNGTLKSGENAGLSVQEIIDKISVACYKDGIRIVDFFKDFDRLKSGIITDRQFSSGLHVGVQKNSSITTEDINQLVEYFRQQDGRIDYRTFCDTVENVFNIPDMEKKPLAHLLRPPRGLLSKTLNGNLTPSEEEDVLNCLETISDRVRKYKLQLFPYFKDFDRSKAFTRNVSKIQFGRVLSTLNLIPDTALFALLCKKFEDPITGDINYPVFCQAVDDEYVSSKIEDLPTETESEIALADKLADSNEYPPDLSNVDINEIMGRLRSHVLSKRIRVKEFFQDMDPLNSGTISKPQFIRCISMFGVSSLGSFNINKAQTEALCKEYKEPNQVNKVNWKKFEHDLESVFTLRELEKNPNARVAPTQMFIMPPPGTAKWDDENLDSAKNYKTIIQNLKLVVNQRRLDCWPPFKDYDKLNRGHVTRKQFYQSLNKLGLTLSEDDLAILEGKFVNNQGVNYLEFLNQLQPNEIEKAKYLDLKNELKKLNTKRPVFEGKPLTDIQSIIMKIKDIVFKRRISIYEWLRDHDKLNSGRLLKETFKRAINLCNLELLGSELEMIINHYGSVKDDRMVEYKDFCFDIEEAFTNSQLEKNPLIEAEQHNPQDPVQQNKLLPDEVDCLELSMAKVAERVRTQRIQLFPRFEDFDRIKNGYVTQNQFRRVLDDIKLASMLNKTELDTVIKNYSVKIGTRNDVNYVAFADRIYELGSFEYRKP